MTHPGTVVHGVGGSQLIGVALASVGLTMGSERNDFDSAVKIYAVSSEIPRTLTVPSGR